MFFKDKLQFLSNFYQSKFLYQGTFWVTVEHAYQASKCKDLEMNEYIHSLSYPAEAKRVGNRVDLRSDWEEVKVDIMTDLVFCKFTQNERLKKKLIETGDEYLEEGNYWHNNFWGNCYCDKCKDIEGENVLGIILMEVRDLLCFQKTKVVHCKKEPYDILIDRTTKWGNPFIKDVHGTREEVVQYHLDWLLGLREAPNGKDPPSFKEIKNKLSGKVLGCWCAPKLCHGNNYIFIIKEI